MIVTEHRIRDIVATIPEIRLNDNVCNKPFFHWGDKFELIRWMKLTKRPYPLIWLLPTADTSADRFTTINKTCNFIIATREPIEDLLNNQRYIKSFDVILNPTLNYLIQGLTKSSISRVTDEWEVFKFPNYAEAKENFTTDVWDASTFNIDVNFNDNCLKKIIYKTI